MCARKLTAALLLVRHLLDVETLKASAAANLCLTFALHITTAIACSALTASIGASRTAGAISGSVGQAHALGMC